MAEDKRNYWLDLFTGTTWQEFIDYGATVTGFRESKLKAAQQIRIGDYLLCYLTGLSRWIGVLQVMSETYVDRVPIWKGEHFPVRLKVKVVSALTPETAVPIYNLKDRLSIFRDLQSPNAWTGHVRGSPAKWDPSDGAAVVESVAEAVRHPVILPVDRAKLERKPTGIKHRDTGLLRMADLIAMQPNLKIPLYIVAPDERREKVIAEVNRPTFSRLQPPMSEVCRFISFGTLQKRLNEMSSVLRYLRPEILEELSESCEIEEV